MNLSNPQNLTGSNNQPVNNLDLDKSEALENVNSELLSLQSINGQDLNLEPENNRNLNNLPTFAQENNGPSNEQNLILEPENNQNLSNFPTQMNNLPVNNHNLNDKSTLEDRVKHDNTKSL